jgi:hypothetical protein
MMGGSAPALKRAVGMLTACLFGAMLTGCCPCLQQVNDVAAACEIPNCVDIIFGNTDDDSNPPEGAHRSEVGPAPGSRSALPMPF